MKVLSLFAGKGGGLDAERSGLWWEMCRLIDEIRPAWVIIENVFALRARGLDRVVSALEEMGYKTNCLGISAIKRRRKMAEQSATLSNLNRCEGHEPGVESTVESLFAFQPWDDEQQEAGKYVREALADAYLAILTTVPPCPTRTRALNALTDARMLANQAITFKGQV